MAEGTAAELDETVRGFVEPVEEWPDGDEIYGFNPPEQLQTWVYRERNSDGTELAAVDRGYCAKLIGAIDPDLVRARCGGGLYRLVIRRGKKSTSRMLSISGPPKSQPLETVSEPAGAAPAAGLAGAPAAATIAGPEVIAEVVARALAPVLAQVSQAVQQVTASPARDPLEMAIRIAEIGRNNAPAAPTSDARDLVKLYMDGLTAGQRMSGEGKSMGEALAEIAPRALESFDRLVAARSVAIGGGASPSPAPGGASPGSNTVNEFVIAGMVAQAVANGTDPTHFADALVVQYPAEQVKQLMAVPAAMLVAHLRRHVKMLPALGTEQCAAFVAQVLEVLPDRLTLDHDAGDDDDGDESGEGREQGPKNQDGATS